MKLLDQGLRGRGHLMTPLTLDFLHRFHNFKRFSRSSPTAIPIGRGQLMPAPVQPLGPRHYTWEGNNTLHHHGNFIPFSLPPFLPSFDTTHPASTQPPLAGASCGTSPHCSSAGPAAPNSGPDLALIWPGSGRDLALIWPSSGRDLALTSSRVVIL